MKPLFFFLILLSLLAAPLTASAKSTPTPYLTSFDQWRAGDVAFGGWSLSGVALTADGKLALDPATAQPGTDPYPPAGYYGINYYNGGSFFVGEALSPEMPSSFAFTQAIASWNAETPAGTWIETLIQVKIGERWTKWFSLGIWASDDSTIQRHSVRLQGDADGYVSVDTWVLAAKKAQPSSYQLKLRLFSADGAATPLVSFASAALSNAVPKKVTFPAGDPANWNTLLAVPECSQMVYPDGGNVWCSPTSASMVLGFWGFLPGPCEPRVRAAVAGVYDVIYDGHGNWPFNTAYAATFGLEASVRRFTSLADVEPWVKAGVPVVVSYAWGKKELTGAPIPTSSGHLAVIVGFDANGNPIVNDPAAATDEDVQRTYLRSEFEPLWIKNSGGTVYLIYPQGSAIP